MLPHALSLIPSEDIDIFLAIKKIVTELPDMTFGSRPDGRKIPIYCHILTRALASVFPTLKVCDGVLNMNYDHSWLMTKNGCVIDPYLIATVGGPIIFDNIPLWKDFYGNQFCFLEHRLEPFGSQVRQLEIAVKEIYEQLRKNGNIK